MYMHKRRIDYIRDIVRYGNKVEIIIPKQILYEKAIEPTNFKTARDSLEILENDDELIVTVENLDDLIHTSITIEIKPDNFENSD